MTGRPMNTVFISYSRDDTQFVAGHLADALSELGYSVWIDRENIPGSTEWWSAITQSVANSGAVIVALSPSSCASTCVQRELEQARYHRRTIVPVLVTPCEPSGNLAWVRQVQWIDFAREQFQTALQRLDRTLRYVGLTPIQREKQPPPAPLLTRVLPGNWSVEFTYEQMKFVEQLTIDPAFFFVGLVFKPPDIASYKYNGNWRIQENELVLDGHWEDGDGHLHHWLLTYYFQRISPSMLEGFNLPDPTLTTWRRV